ncbi:MAG: glucose-1-phosphate adenylyltransferase [Tissierellia bacterium]|nr:glucose-1-phosphate adenylyltransferase [Tissierellia bacterium]
MAKDRILALILAGGQGSRLKALTKKVAKPAVGFGGKYRIIDFALSNTTNSDIDDVAILTQYKHHLLNDHLGIGAPWDYDRNLGGLIVLSPFTSEEGGRWFTGTANAIYENLDVLDEMNLDYMLILSGDHIYKMNYNKMLAAHKEKKAACTIAVMEVPWEEASRFGIMNTEISGRIKEFEEKPEKPKSNLASMGIYIFDWPVLREYLLKDELDTESEHDFGKNIIPAMLHAGLPMFSYTFNGYWKDVGTVRSYWQANMDLLDPENSLDLFDKTWRIFTKTKNIPPQKIEKGSTVIHSLVTEGCLIKGAVNNSVLFDEVIVEKDAKVTNSVILSRAHIKAGAVVDHAIIMEDVVIEENQVVGGKPDTIYLVSQDGMTEE